MGKREMRRQMAGRAVFVGCQFCGETDKPLRNYAGRKICPDCLKKQPVPNSGTKEEKR